MRQLLLDLMPTLSILEALRRSLHLKEKSLLQTQKTLKIKVDNGRTRLLHSLFNSKTIIENVQ